jgi:hypothetical protein
MLIVLLAALSYAPAAPADAIQRPRLILTRPRIAGLRSSLSTTRASLWRPVQRKVQPCCVPSMSDANRFYIGDTMPCSAAYWMTGDAPRCHSRPVAAGDSGGQRWSGSANLGVPHGCWVRPSCTLAA